MAQEVLDQHEVGARIEQVSSEAVAQTVRRITEGQASVDAGAMEDGPGCIFPGGRRTR
jgi:hypothetical protein